MLIITRYVIILQYIIKTGNIIKVTLLSNVMRYIVTNNR